MAYNKFTLQDLKEKLNLEIINQEWLPNSFPAVLADDLLLQLLNDAKTEALSSRVGCARCFAHQTTNHRTQQNESLS